MLGSRTFPLHEGKFVFFQTSLIEEEWPIFIYHFIPSNTDKPRNTNFSKPKNMDQPRMGLVMGLVISNLYYVL